MLQGFNLIFHNLFPFSLNCAQFPCSLEPFVPHLLQLHLEYSEGREGICLKCPLGLYPAGGRLIYWHKAKNWQFWPVISMASFTIVSKCLTKMCLFLLYHSPNENTEKKQTCAAQAGKVDSRTEDNSSLSNNPVLQLETFLPALQCLPGVVLLFPKLNGCGRTILCCASCNTVRPRQEIFDTCKQHSSVHTRELSSISWDVKEGLDSKPVKSSQCIKQIRNILCETHSESSYNRHKTDKITLLFPEINYRETT